MAKKKTRDENKFNDWYERVGKRLFDENNLKRSKKWMRTIYKDIMKELNPDTGKNYTSEEALLKIRRRREFMSESELGMRNQINMMIEQDPSFKRKIKGGRAYSFEGETYILDKHMKIYKLSFKSLKKGGTPWIDYEEMLIPEEPKENETYIERYERLERDKKARQDFYDKIGGKNKLIEGVLLNWW